MPLCLLVFYSSTVSYTLFFFFFNDTATTEIYTLSLHDALPICVFLTTVAPRQCRLELLRLEASGPRRQLAAHRLLLAALERPADRKSTRLNSSHSQISYAVFCLKKKKNKKKNT